MSTTGTRVVEFRAVLRLIALCAFPAMVGCGVAENMEKAARNSAERDNVGPVLKAFHRLYVDFHDTNRRGPADWKELEAYATKAGNVQAVQNAQQLGCEVAWGTGFSGLPIGTQEYVLPHRPQDLQDDGGYVLFLDGSTWFLKADEIRQKLEQRKQAKKWPSGLRGAAAASQPVRVRPHRRLRPPRFPQPERRHRQGRSSPAVLR